MTSMKPLFDTVRRIKGAPLTQAEVDAINAAMAGQISVTARVGMRTSASGIALIHSFETLRLTAYRDPGSATGLPITNGWGTTIEENGKPIILGTVWTKEKADRLFTRDLTATELGVNLLLGNALTTQRQFDALVSFAYNVGLDIDEDDKAEGLGDSTLLRKHKAADYLGAADEFPKWNKNDGKVMAGLTRRRKDERALYLGHAA
jgi:lysozyme